MIVLILICMYIQYTYDHIDVDDDFDHVDDYADFDVIVYTNDHVNISTYVDVDVDVDGTS